MNESKTQQEKNRVVWEAPGIDITLFDRTEHPVKVRETEAEITRDHLRKIPSEYAHEPGVNTRKYPDGLRVNWLYVQYGIGAAGFGVIGYGIYLLFSAVITWLLSLNWEVIFRFIGYAILCVVLGLLAMLAVFETARNRKYRKRGTSVQSQEEKQGPVIINQTVIINKK